MGLGSLFRTRPAGPVHTRMIVSDGWRIGPSTEVAGNIGWGWYSYHRALTIPGVDRAVSLISDLLGGLPWDAYTEHGRDFAEKLNPRPILLEQPNPEETRVNTISAWAIDLLLHGNAFGVIAERNAAGVPTAITPVPVPFVGVRRVNGSTYSQLPTGAIEYQVGGRFFGAGEVFHVKGRCAPGALRGMGVLECHLHGHGVLDHAAELARQARNISQNGVPTGVLKVTNPDATQDDMLATKSGWLTNMRDRTIAVLNATTEFTPLAWDPEKMQLLDARKFSLLEVANVFGLPPRFLGAPSGDSMTYANSETESIDLIKFTLGGHLARFEQTLALLFPRGTWVKANLDALLRADTVARYAAHAQGIGAGFLLRSEARALEDLPPVPGIDDEPLPKKAETSLLKTDPVSASLAQVPAPGGNQPTQQGANP